MNKTYKIKNIPTGKRFIEGSHSSLMFATNLTQKSGEQNTRLCVSENGLAEWIDVTREVISVDDSVHKEIIGVCNKAIQQILEEKKIFPTQESLTKSAIKVIKNGVCRQPQPTEPNYDDLCLKFLNQMYENSPHNTVSWVKFRPQQVEDFLRTRGLFVKDITKRREKFIKKLRKIGVERYGYEFRISEDSVIPMITKKR